MAMIQCPQCKKQISDQAEACVHCGYKLKKELYYCKECGGMLEETDKICPHCGRPLERKDNEDTRKKKKKHILRYILLTIFVLVIGFFGYMEYQAYKWNSYFEMVNEMQEVRNSTVDVVNQSQNLLMKVWYNSIGKISDPETDRFTSPNGYFVEDFNEALNLLYEDEEFSKNLSLIEEKQNELRKLEKQLPEPPTEYEEFHEDTIKLMDGWIEISMNILSPNKSYLEMNDVFNELIQEQNDLLMELDSY